MLVVCLNGDKRMHLPMNKPSAQWAAYTPILCLHHANNFFSFLLTYVKNFVEKGYIVTYLWEYKLSKS